jgi:hypothetical protein
MSYKPKRDTSRLLIRVPPAVRQWLAARAKRAASSMGGEACRVILDSMDREERERRAEQREAAP